MLSLKITGREHSDVKHAYPRGDTRHGRHYSCSALALVRSGLSPIPSLSLHLLSEAREARGKIEEGLHLPWVYQEMKKFWNLSSGRQNYEIPMGLVKCHVNVCIP